MSEEKAKEILHMGIDLGTSRSSISTSAEQRHMIDSFVGWPADMVAKKVLKKNVLVGREALENRVMLDLHRPLERGLIKEGSETDIEAVRVILQHLTKKAGVDKARKAGQRARAVIGVPAEALRVNRQQLRIALKGIVDSLMVVSEPFAVAYGLDALLHALVIDIGAGTTDFCVMNGRYPSEDDQRTLTNAGDSIDDQLAKLVAAKFPEAQFSEHMVREWKEKYSFVGDAKEPIRVTAPVAGKPTDLDITDCVQEACFSVVEPIIETMLDLVSKVQPEYQEAVRNNVILSGGGALIGNLGDAIEKGLFDIGGGKVRVVQDPVFVGSDGSLAIALDAPEEDWDKLS